MRIVAKSTLKRFWTKYPETEIAILDWYEIVQINNWKNHHAVKIIFPNASIISGKRIVFNIKGNNYRLIVDLEYKYQLVFIVWIGTHKDYDKINLLKIKYYGKNKK